MDKIVQAIKYRTLLKLYQEQGMQQLKLQKQVDALASRPSYQYDPEVSDAHATDSYNISRSTSRLGRHTSPPGFKTT